jgi:hypothetical protein
MSTNEDLLLILLDHMSTCGYTHAQTSSYIRSSNLFNNILYIYKKHSMSFYQPCISIFQLKLHADVDTILTLTLSYL